MAHLGPLSDYNYEQVIQKPVHSNYSFPDPSKKLHDYSVKEFFYDISFDDYEVPKEFENFGTAAWAYDIDRHVVRFVIPINGEAREQAEETIRRIVQEYNRPHIAEHPNYRNLIFGQNAQGIESYNQDIWYPVRGIRPVKENIFTKLKKFAKNIWKK